MNTEKSRNRSSPADSPKRITVYFPKEDTSNSRVIDQIEKKKQSLQKIQNSLVLSVDEPEKPKK